MSVKPKSCRGLKFVFPSVIAAVALFVAVDPFHLTVVANDPNFYAHHVEQPPASKLIFPRDRESKLKVSVRRFVNEGNGPESLAFHPSGGGLDGGLYTGISDGRVVRWDGPERGWSEFATTSPNRTDICNPGQSFVATVKNEHICGRPLGLRFGANSDLYIADAYHGLLKVGPEGGLAKPLVTEAEGTPLRFTNDLDVSADGSVYFSDSSAKYQRRNFFLLVLSGDNSGRVLKYDPKTKETKVLLRGLQFPNGVALSKDESFLVIAESVPGRLLRYWLNGPKSGITEVFAVLPGYPDNVRTNSKGEFWVALHCRRNLPTRLSGTFPVLRKVFLRLPLPFKLVYRIFNGGEPHGMVVRYSEEGELLELLEDERGEVVKYASEVQEREGKLWVGSVLLPYVAVYDMKEFDSTSSRYQPT